MRLMKRLLLAAILVVVGFVALLGVEILVALRRDYLPTSPALELNGTFGPPGGRARLKLVVLGDSTAAGVGALAPADAYPTLLARRLATAGDRRVELVALGISGARVKDVLEDQVPKAIRAEPDLVFIGIGANDAIHVTPLDQVAQDMGAALDLLLDAGVTVVVAGAPDMRAAAFLEPLRTLAGWRGQQVTDAIADAARARGVPVVPLAAKTGQFFGADPEAHYSTDDFHPGPGGYERWADAISPVLRRALEESR